MSLFLPFLPPKPDNNPSVAVSIPLQSGPTPQAGRQADRQGWEKSPGPSHLFTPSATSAILTYNHYHDDGTDSSQHDHHLRRQTGTEHEPCTETGPRTGLCLPYGHNLRSIGPATSCCLLPVACLFVFFLLEFQWIGKPCEVSAGATKEPGETFCRRH